MIHGYRVTDEQVSDSHLMDTTTTASFNDLTSALTDASPTMIPTQAVTDQPEYYDEMFESSPSSSTYQPALGLSSVRPTRVRTRTTRSRTTRTRINRSTTSKQVSKQDPVRPFCQNRPCRFPYFASRPGAGFRRTPPTTSVNYYPSSPTPVIQREPIISVTPSPQPLNINLSIFVNSATPAGQQIAISSLPDENGNVVVALKPTPLPTPTKPLVDEVEYYDDDSALKPYVEENELAAYGGIENFKPLHQKRPNEERDSGIVTV